jgi:hypothetical protein
MAGQNHKSQLSRAEPTGALRCAGLGVHRQIQQMILSCHDSVIRCCLDRSQLAAAAAEAEMNAFLRSHRVLTVKKELVADGESSFWRRKHLPHAD